MGGLRLLRAHVVMRHGDRSPIFNCWEPFPLSGEESWGWARRLPSKEVIDDLEKPFQVLMADGSSSGAVARKTRDANMGVFGSLTRRGLSQTRALGAAMRKYLMGDDCGHVNPSDVLVMSSNFNRTIRSAASAVSAFSASSSAENAIPIRVVEGETDHISVSSHS